MQKNYITLHKAAQEEMVISRSRFIGWARPADTEEAAVAFIEEVKKRHWDATHNVWAYVLGTQTQRYSDDGEPHGTAGLPVLEIMRKTGVQDAVVVVTRYFGGIKLGAGGLVRAYTQAAKLAVEQSGIIERRLYITRYITTTYDLIGKFQRELAAKGYLLEDTVYSDQVVFTVAIPPEEAVALERLTAELTAGLGLIREGPCAYRDFPLDHPHTFGTDNAGKSDKA